MKQQVFAALEDVVSRGVPARHEYVVPLGRRDGRGPAASRARRRDALLQPGRRAPARRARPHARPPTTSTLATAWDVTKKLGKRGVLVEDAPAFVVNRLLTRQSSVLMQALEHGNTFEETDEAALRLGIPMPPSALLAMVGPRVANHVLHTLHDAFPDRFPLSPTLENFANGEMDIVLTGERRQTVDEIHAAILEALADEARHLLDEGVVASAAEIDACLILGAGFPFFRGGLTKYLDQEGISTASPATRSPERRSAPPSGRVPVQFRATAPLDAPETRECADPQGMQHHSRVLRICTRPTSTRHIRRRSRQRAWKPPRSALRPGTASRSSTPVRTPLSPLLPAPRAAGRSTTRSPRWMPATAPPRTAGASATG